MSISIKKEIDNTDLFIVRLNIEVNVDDNSSLPNIEMTNIIDKTILGDLDFIIDEIRKKQNQIGCNNQ